MGTPPVDWGPQDSDGYRPPSYSQGRQSGATAPAPARPGAKGNKGGKMVIVYSIIWVVASIAIGLMWASVFG